MVSERECAQVWQETDRTHQHVQSIAVVLAVEALGLDEQVTREMRQCWVKEVKRAITDYCFASIPFRGHSSPVRLINALLPEDLAAKLRDS